MLKLSTALRALVTGLMLGLFLLPASASAGTNYELVTNTQSVPYVIVQPGNTLDGLAEEYGLTWQEIYCANEQVIGPDPNLIIPGEKLYLESAQCNTVQQATAAAPSNPVQQPEDITGTPQQIAWQLLASYGNDAPEQYSCLNSIIMSESSWNVNAQNPDSGAYGIPQALPGYKMAGPWGSDWQNSAYVQLYWMIKIYIPDVYGTPCAAWAFHLANGYY